MNTRALWTGLAGLGLLVVAGLMVPALPELPPFAAGERVALLWDAPELPPDVLALVQRAHAAGAIVRVAGPQESLADFAPARCYRPAPWPEQPTGFHPDQWPHIPRGADTNGLQMLVLTPAELAAKNTAVLAAGFVYAWRKGAFRRTLPPPAPARAVVPPRTNLDLAKLYFSPPGIRLADDV